MARGSIAKANLMLLRGAKRAGNEVSKFSAGRCGGVSKSNGKIEESTCWVPHPRTGIYFPEGHEWVMDDVPEGASHFTQAYWFRNLDGVDN
ncbi:Late embryogenesis abundant protein [Sesbania bispinosa]|nr:Late embryogenesis abundant protein [Sesbania bispinosa]